MIKVAFKIETNTCGNKQVFAFFPELEISEGFFTSYTHEEQHNPCQKSYFNHRKWAKYDEYIGLYKELIQRGYTNLVVLNKDFKKENENAK